jgi:hypothetical protein
VGVGDLLFVIIHTDDVMTNLCEAGPRHLADVSWTNDGNVHNSQDLVANLLPALVVIPLR